MPKEHAASRPESCAWVFKEFPHAYAIHTFISWISANLFLFVTCFIVLPFPFINQGSHRNSETQFHDFSLIFHDQQCYFHDY